MKGAVIGIGTNVGSREENLGEAVAALSLLPGTNVVSVSSVYETEPVGYTDQADFLNICVLLETSLSPRALLGACLGIEAGLGRVRLFKNGPRVIDLDLLVFEGFRSDDAELTLPHPRMFERDFVLVPLKDIMPGTFIETEYRGAVENFFSDPSIQHLRVRKTGGLQYDV